MFQRSSVMIKNAQWLKKSLGLKAKRVVFSAEDVRVVQSACAYVVDFVLFTYFLSV